MKKFLPSLICIFTVCALPAAEEIDAIKLRETLRETTLAHEDTAKLKADFKAQKERLEANIKLLNSLKEKLSADIVKEKKLLEEKKNRNAEVLKELEQFARFEEKLGAILYASPLIKSGNFEDPYAAARDLFTKLRNAVKNSDTLYVTSGASGKRILHLGSAATLVEENDPNVSRLCDMLEGKAPFDFVRIRINGKNAQ